MVGCSSHTTDHTNEIQSEKTSETLEEKDGTVISFEQIEVTGLDPTLNAYQMMYWSEGVETAAYVTVPKKRGYYYLGVSCHGGYVIPLNEKHVRDVPGVKFGAESMLREMHSEIITLTPLYRGYADSMGTVPGLYGATVDTNNAIDALYAYFKEGNMESSVRSGYISLSGASLGGGVALKLSQMRNDIGNVVAINPYVGLDLLYPWAENNPDNAWNKGFLETYHNEFGDYDPTSLQSKEESIEIKRSYTPTLIVQGQEDEVMNWELTQAFYEKFKKENQNEHTTLKLIPEGDHGMTEKQDELNKIIDEWYEEIGAL
jgi:alpha/beta superfamily hydrolase